jgi:transposase
MTYIGIDLHREYFVAHAENEHGDKLLSKKYENSSESVTELVSQFEEVKVVVEATRNWMWLISALEDEGCDVTMAHPFRTKAIAAAKIKTDSIDAQTLCQLLRAGLIPQSYISTKEEQGHRELVRGRISLVRDRTLLKNRIKAILGKENLNFSGSDLFGKTGREWLKAQSLPESAEMMANIYLQMIDNADWQVGQVDKTINEKSSSLPQVTLLTSIPGIGSTTAFLLASEIGNIQRFNSHKKFASYFGLVPSLSQSGNHAHYGRITKVGNPYVRWALVQTAHRIIRMEPEWEKFAKRIMYRSGKKKAIVAVARKLAVLVYTVLKRQQPYQKKYPVISRQPKLANEAKPAILPGH